MKSKEISRKSLLNVLSLFGCDRPESGGNVDILQREIAFENNEGMLERLGLINQLQGRWLEWCGLINLDLSWQQLIHNWSDKELRFALQATTNTVPTPLNLRR